MYSKNYTEARQKFLSLAQTCGAEIKSFPISAQGVQGEDLAIDVAILGAKNPRKVVMVTSGLHGVEGFLGSAIQCAWLDNLRRNPVDWGSHAVVLCHALNPYGFSWQRRVNENNVDLNRNFIFPKQQFLGAPPLLKKLKWLQKPVSVHNKLFMIDLYLYGSILYHTYDAFKNCLILGQFEYPQGLFYGGKKYEEATQIINSQLNSWTRQAPYVFHLDFHTGLGKYGNCHLLTFEGSEAKRTGWLQSKFGKDKIEFYGTGLVIWGVPTALMGGWVGEHFALEKKKYTYLTAEYGTYPSTSIFKALYQENRFFNHRGQSYESAKKELMEMFCPADPIWREKCVTSGISMISQCLNVVEDDVWE